MPFDWFAHQPPPAPPPAASSWEDDTAEAAKAYDAGRLDEAERRLEAARTRVANGTGDDLVVAASLVNLAVVRRARGDTDEALALQRDALAIREKTLGPDQADVATSLNNIAGLYAARDDYAAAEPLLVRALAIREKALGNDHRLTAQSLNNLALLYAARGRHGDAEPLYRRALATFEKRDNCRDLAVALENFAALLDETGRRAEAERTEARARECRLSAPSTPAYASGQRQ